MRRHALRLALPSWLASHEGFDRASVYSAGLRALCSRHCSSLMTLCERKSQRMQASASCPPSPTSSVRLQVGLGGPPGGSGASQIGESRNLGCDPRSAQSDESWVGVGETTPTWLTTNTRAGSLAADHC
jgi:hypothetical protein